MKPAFERADRRRPLRAAVIVALVVVAVSLVAVALRTPDPPVWTPPTSTAAPTSDRAVFLGDSYTQGVGASTPDTRWSALVSEGRGWQEINLGRGGTGYVTTAGSDGCGRVFCPAYRDMIDEAVRQGPGVIIVSGGQNDLQAATQSPDEVRQAIEDFYRSLRDAFPETPVVALGPSTPGTAGQTARGMDDAVRDASSAIGATYVSLLDPPAFSRSSVLDDGAHVDDSGHRAIADRVLAAALP